jgi:Clr5 domain
MASQYSAANWEQWRRRIQELYVHADLPLRSVVAALQHEGFHVNERMVRTRLAQWKLDVKNNKEPRDADRRAAVL